MTGGVLAVFATEAGAVIGIHPAAYVAARRSAASELPPIQIGTERLRGAGNAWMSRGEVPSFERERFTLPVELYHLECFFEEGVALLEVDPQREVFGLEVAGTSAQVETAL